MENDGITGTLVSLLSGQGPITDPSSSIVMMITLTTITIPLNITAAIHSD